MVVDKADYLDKMKNLLNDTRNGILNFAINQEERVGNILKELVGSNGISEERRRSIS